VRIGLFVGVKTRCIPTRPPHPAPNVRDDREAPLLIEAGCAEISTLSDKTKVKYLRPDT
jgi:hypothetical protein